MAIGTAAAIVGGGLLSGIGELFQDKPFIPELDQGYFSTLNLRNDPVNVALAFDALLQLGNTEGATNLLQQTSPLNQFIEKVRSAPIRLEDQNSAVNIARHLYETGRMPTAEEWGGQQDRDAAVKAFNNAIGYGGIDRGLVDQLNPTTRSQFNARIEQTIAQSAGGATGAARSSALRQLAQRIQGMEGGGASSFRGLTDVATNVYQQNLDEQFRKRRESTLAAANAGGYNPAGVLGDLEQEYLRQASATPLQANQLATTLAANEDRDFNNLLTYLLSGTQTGQQSAQVTNQAALGSAGIAADQFKAANAARLAAIAGQPPTNPVGNALSGIGSTISTAGLLPELNRKPGVDTTRTPITPS